MEEMLQELFQFLQANNLNNLMTSLIISIVGIIIVLVKTSKGSLQKKVGSFSSINLDDYVLIIENVIYSFNDVVIKKKKDVTKLELNNLVDKGGVFNVKKKNV